MLAGRVLRVRTASGVAQEIYALLVVYQLVRPTISDAAYSQGLDPDRGSFTIAWQAAKDEVILATDAIGTASIDLVGAIGARVLADPLPPAVGGRRPRRLGRGGSTRGSSPLPTPALTSLPSATDHCPGWPTSVRSYEKRHSPPLAASATSARCLYAQLNSSSATPSSLASSACVWRGKSKSPVNSRSRSHHSMSPHWTVSFSARRPKIRIRSSANASRRCGKPTIPLAKSPQSAWPGGRQRWPRHQPVPGRPAARGNAIAQPPRRPLTGQGDVPHGLGSSTDAPRIGAAVDHNVTTDQRRP